MLGIIFMTQSSDCNSHISLLETKERKAAMMISASTLALTLNRDVNMSLKTPFSV